MEKYLIVRPFFVSPGGGVFFYLSEDEITTSFLNSLFPPRIILVTAFFWKNYPKYNGCKNLEKIIKESNSFLTIIFMEQKYASKILRRGNISSTIPITSVAVSINPVPIHFEAIDFAEEYELFSSGREEPRNLKKDKKVDLPPRVFHKEDYGEIFENNNLIQIDPHWSDYKLEDPPYIRMN